MVQVHEVNVAFFLEGGAKETVSLNDERIYTDGNYRSHLTNDAFNSKGAQLEPDVNRAAKIDFWNASKTLYLKVAGTIYA